jgi:Flp pilus assembly protein TadB
MIANILFPFIFGLGLLLIYVSLWKKLKKWIFGSFRKGSRITERLQHSFHQNRPTWIKRCDRMISVSGIPLNSENLFLFSVVFVLPGSFWGMEAFQNVWMGMVFGFITGSFPGLYIYYRSYERKKEMLSLMMPALQIFLGVYSSHPNIRFCLYQCTPLLPSYIRYEFQILTNSLHTGTPFEEALEEFGERVGNPIAEDFADLLMVAEERGEDIQSSLINLINRTQSFKFNNEMERTELVDIRYGTMVIIGLTLFLVIYNIRLGDSPFQQTNPILTFYFHTKSGQTIIALVTIVQFIALLGSIWVGRKKI